MENATFEIPRGIQARIASLRDETVWRSDRLEARIDRLDLGMRKDRRNAAGMRVMMRATAGDLDARVSPVEERVAALESRTGWNSSGVKCSVLLRRLTEREALGRPAR